MSVCELCSGPHATSACSKGRIFVEQCRAGTPDEYRPPRRFLEPFVMDDLAERRWQIKAAQDRRSSEERTRKRRLRLVS